MTHLQHTSRRLWLPLLSVLALFSALTAYAAVNFDIPAGPAPAALQTFIKQADTPVMFSPGELKDIQTNAVTGEFEPAAALTMMLKDSGFEAKRNGGNKFVVAKINASRLGAIEGEIREETSGHGIAGAKVQLSGTDRVATTDKRGRFVIEGVPAGGQVLFIVAEGMQNTRVTDIVVSAGHSLALSPITIPVVKEGALKLEVFVVSAKKNDEVLELDPYAVSGQKQKPFTGANVDVPRSIDDAVPRVIFEAKSIERSGSVNVEDFLKSQLSMNATFTRPGTGTSPITMTGATNSTIDLRGIGADKTLILVNGRRQMATGTFGSSGQSNLNLIPIGEIERIEVLPASAAGIYGGSAIGGVVNVILKRNFSGGEIRVNYGSPMDTDASTATVAANYGLTLEGGRTQVRFGATWSDGTELRLGDRRDIYLANLDRILTNFPAYFNNSSFSFASLRPNITPTTATQTTLTLKDGTVLATPRTFVGAGIGPGTPASQVYASLAANVGQISRGMSNANDINSAGASLSQTPRNLTYTASVRREMRPWIELFSDFSYTNERFQGIYNPITGASIISVPANAAANPFTTAVWVSAPNNATASQRRESITRSLTLGALLKLPAGWTGELDYTWSGSSARYAYSLTDSTTLTADMVSGAFNPFVDTVLFPLSMDRYLAPLNSAQTFALEDYALRANGPVPVLPWGPINLTLGLEHRKGTNGRQTIDTIFPLSPVDNSHNVYFAKKSRTDSAYVEAQVPLVPRDRFKFVHSLELQVAGRTERFEADTGSTGIFGSVGRNPPTFTIVGVNRSGAPVFDTASYASTDFTVALKYQPRPDLIFRASRGTGFLPPTSAQLAPSNTPSTTLTTVTDPTTGTSVGVTTVGGGNPGLVPQNSISTNAGIIWEPRTGPLRGLRANAEYYKIEQFDFISAPTAQDVVNFPDVFPGRVTRNASGVITQIDISSANLFLRDTQGVDLTLAYPLKTGAGQFTFRGAGTIILHNYNQFSLILPKVDSVGFPSDGGGLKRKGILSLDWERDRWTAGWTVNYFGSYRQAGAPDSPQLIRLPTATFNILRYFLPQGSDTIPSQTYHDVFVGYTFQSRGDAARGRVAHAILDGLQVQAGVRNVFDKVPPFDAFAANNSYYVSRFGDLQLRTYWVSLRKQF